MLLGQSCQQPMTPIKTPKNLGPPVVEFIQQLLGFPHPLNFLKEFDLFASSTSFLTLPLKNMLPRHRKVQAQLVEWMLFSVPVRLLFQQPITQERMTFYVIQLTCSGISKPSQIRLPEISAFSFGDCLTIWDKLNVLSTVTPVLISFSALSVYSMIRFYSKYFFLTICVCRK